jgi:hypothetical protein
LLDERLNRGTIARTRYVDRPVGVEPGDSGKRGESVMIGDRRTAIATQLVAHAIEHKHFGLKRIGDLGGTRRHHGHAA